MFSIIAAIGQNNALGWNNQMPWSLPADLRRFKEITWGHTIIMGRKTFLSLPRVLPHRRHLVLSQDPYFMVANPSVIIVRSLGNIWNYLSEEEENFVIGGGEIFRQFLPLTEKMYLTLIHREFPADTFFPEIDWEEWKVIDQSQGVVDQENPFPHTFLTMIRQK